MFDLARIKIDLERAIKERDNWKMRGTDTPYLTYHEQLELYEQRVDRILNKIEKETK